MCRGGIGASLCEKSLNIREDRKNPVHIQSAKTPFPVGIKLHLASPGSPDEKGFEFCVVKNLRRISLCAPFDHQGTGTCSDGRRRGGACHGGKTSVRSRTGDIYTGSRYIGFDDPCAGVSSAGIDEQAVIVSIISSGCESHLSSGGGCDGGVGVRS